VSIFFRVPAAPPMTSPPHVSSSISAGDLFWWRVDEPTNPMVINATMGFARPLTLAEVRDALRPHVENNLRLQSVPKPLRIGSWRPYFLVTVLLSLAAAPFWSGCACTAVALGLLLGVVLETYLGRQWCWAKVKGFTIEDHVRLHSLQDPTPECLHQFIDQEASKQLPRDQAQWLVFVIHNVEGGGSRLLFRFHHVVGDGAGLGVWFYHLCTDDERKLADAEERKATIAKRKSERPQRKRPSLLTVLDGLLATVLIIVGGTWKMLLGLWRDSNSPLKGPRSGHKRTARFSPKLEFQVDEVKRVGKSIRSDITVNDTMCALVAGALRRYFQALSLHPDQMVVRMTMPYNMRRNPLAPVRLENAFSVLFKSLPVHLATPEERILHFHVRMLLLKRGVEATLGAILTESLTWLPTALMRLVVLRFTICSSAVLTNVQATTQPFAICGQPFQDCAFWVPTSSDIGIGISILTYVDKININFIADSSLIDDWAPFVEHLAQEWEEMKGLPTKTGLKVDCCPDIQAGTMDVLRACARWGFPRNCR